VEDTHYIIGSALGPHPFPTIVAYFQSVIGKECRQFFDENPPYPDYVIACVGGGSNSIGIFRGFLDLEDVKLIGIEAGGRSAKLGEHAMSINYGEKGIFRVALALWCKMRLDRLPQYTLFQLGLIILELAQSMRIYIPQKGLHTKL